MNPSPRFLRSVPVSAPVCALFALCLVACDAAGPADGGSAAPSVAPPAVVPVAKPVRPEDVVWEPEALRVLKEDVVARAGSGATRLRGVVIDPEGTPVAGATVSLWALPTASLSGFIPERHASAVTGEDGRFEVGPGPEPWDALGLLTAEAPGFARTALRSRVIVKEGIPSADPGVEVEVPMRRGWPVRGRVRTRSGRTPDGPVHVWALGESGWFQALETTDDGGAFRFLAPEETLYMHCVAGHHPDAREVLPVRADGENEVSFVLPEGRDIRGRVVDAETGAPVPGAVFRAYYGETRILRADGEGNFTVPRYWFQAFQVRAPGYAERIHQLTVDAGRPDAPPETVKLLPGVVVRGRVEDLDGKPLAGARLWCYALSRTGDFVDVSGPLSREDGTFTFVGLPAPGEGREIRVFARKPGFAEGHSAAITGAPRTVIDGVVVRAPRLVRVAGRILDENDEPRPGRLFITWGRDTELAPYERMLALGTGVRAGEDGRWSAMVPERSVLSLSADGGQFRPAEAKWDVPAWSGNAEVAGEGEPRTLRVFRGLTLRGRVMDAAGRPVRRGEVRVEAHPPGDPRPPADAFVNADGEFVAAGLDPGLYDISILVHPEYLQEVVRELEAGQDPVHVRMRRAGGVSGRLVLPGPLPAGTLPRVRLRALGETLPLPSRMDFDVSAADLRFQAGPLAPTDYSVTVVAGAWRRDLPRVTVPDGEGLDLGDVVLGEGGTVTGRVTAPGGPLADVAVELFRAREDGARERLAEVRTDADGAYVARGLPAGPVGVTLWARDHPPVEIHTSVAEGAETACDVAVPAGADVVVIVADDAGSPVPGARVLFRNGKGGVLCWDRRSDRAGPHVTGGDGRLEAAGLPAGPLSLHAELPGTGAAMAEIEAVPGEVREVRVTLR